MNIDETNQKILKILEKDGRQSFIDIAKKIGIKVKGEYVIKAK